MKISIIGSGYVGLCTGIGFASLGHDVICIDVDAAKVEMINNSVPPFFEHGIADAMRQCKISATQDIEEINNTGITFICVGTPSDEKGSIDLSYVRQAAENIGRSLRNKDAYHLVVMKSTVVPGTTESIIPLIGKFGKKPGEFGVCMNPEFLQEGSALSDFLRPDRIIIGELDKKSGNALEELYKPFNVPVIRTNIRTAEMIKYAANAFLASRISLINELGNICKKLGIDTYDVAKAIGHDKRIGPYFLQSGIGFGGSCFRKDAAAILAKANELGCKANIIESVLEMNAKQRLQIINILKEKTGIKGTKIAVLGLAFKPGTDDTRDAPSIDIIRKLLAEGAAVRAYDPKASENMKKIFPEITYCSSAAEALKGSDACLVLTEWEEFKKLSDKDFSAMSQKTIIEGRKVLDPEKVSGLFKKPKVFRMKAIILAAGKGTRLQPLTYGIPKPLLPIKGRPMIDWVIRSILSYDRIDEIIIAISGTTGDDLQERILSHTHGICIDSYVKNLGYNCNIRTIPTPQRETSGDLKFVLEEANIRKDKVLVVYGDNLTSFDVGKMDEYHDECRKELGIASTVLLFEAPEKDVSRFGIANIAMEGRFSLIKEFVEKPLHAASRLANGGYYIIETSEVFDMLSKERIKVEHSLFPVLASAGRLAGFVTKLPFWIDISTLESYEEANRLAHDGLIIPPSGKSETNNKERGVR